MRRKKTSILYRMSKPKKNSATELSDPLRARIQSELKNLGIVHPSLVDKLLVEVEASVALASEESEKLIAAALEEGAALQAKAKEIALKKALKPAHVCQALARLHLQQAPDAVENKPSAPPSAIPHSAAVPDQPATAQPKPPASAGVSGSASPQGDGPSGDTHTTDSQQPLL